jgi:thioredoxin reductase
MDATPPVAARATDPWAIDGKFAPPEEHAQLLVVGAGPAGIAAALEGARLGLRVVLIDENPIPATLMGLDVPLFYGQRMTAAVQEPARMVERLVAATPGMDAAFDAGVDVRLGITAWGVFANGAALGALPARVAGLTDGARSWMCGFDALVLATGARDLVLGFPGVDMPGVMGARALHSLLARYDAFDGKRLVILGSGDLAVQTALHALDRGLEVASMVEVLPEAQAAPAGLAALDARGVAVRIATTILRAESDGMGLDAAVLRRADGTEERVACDTICLAIGAVPVIDLAAAAGCRTAYRGDLGGHVPVLSALGASSTAAIFCAGDCAGLADTADCETQGRLAAASAAAWLAHSEPPATPPAPAARTDVTGYRMAWMRALLEAGGMQAPACLCEEVSRAELLGIKPPRYLGCASAPMAARDGQSLLRDGPLNPDQIKRLTRAGMGVCQGRRCREQIALLLAAESGASPGAVPLASYRAPVRPLPLRVLADAETMRDGWDVWFGIRTQWVTYDAIGTPAEAGMLAGNMHA